MKKIMLIAAAAAGLVAMADGVESGVVGYTQVSVAAGKMVGLAVQFKDPTAATDSIPIKDLVTADVPKTGTAAIASVDQLMVWDTTISNWKYYYNRRNVGWCLKGETTLTTDTAKPGDSIFFMRPGSADATLTLAGEVAVVDATKSINVAAGKMVALCNPWPVAFPIASFSACVDVRKSGTAAIASVDQLMIWDTTISNWVYYYDRRNVGYCKKGETTLTTDVIPVGMGVCFMRPGSADAVITFTKPAGL